MYMCLSVCVCVCVCVWYTFQAQEHSDRVHRVNIYLRGWAVIVLRWVEEGLLWKTIDWDLK